MSDFLLTPDRCAALLALMTAITLLSLAALLCQITRTRRARRDNKVLKQSLRNLRARDQGAAILTPLTRP